MNPLTTPVLQARDLIFDGIMHRAGETITEAVARERANNIATALIPLLEDLQRGAVVKGEIGAVPTITVLDCPGCGAAGTVRCDANGMCFCTVCRFGFSKGDDHA